MVVHSDSVPKKISALSESYPSLPTNFGDQALQPSNLFFVLSFQLRPRSFIHGVGCIYAKESV